MASGRTSIFVVAGVGVLHRSGGWLAVSGSGAPSSASLIPRQPEGG